MHDDSSFLAAIAADRENDGLRLVYADWLEEHEDDRQRKSELREQILTCENLLIG